MIGVLIFDAQQRVPIFHSSHLNREFVDGALDVVLADRAAQFSYVVGPPSLYRGSAAGSAGADNSSAEESSSSFFDSNNNNQHQHQHANEHGSGAGERKKLSNSLLHSSLLCGVVESQHKQQEGAGGGGGDQHQQNQQQLGGGHRPPHWPKLVRAPGVPLGRASVSPSCPVLPRNATANRMHSVQLTQRQVHSSKALNEGCVSIADGKSSAAAAHAWLHPSVAPCTTEYAAQWIAAYGDPPAVASPMQQAPGQQQKPSTRMTGGGGGGGSCQGGDMGKHATAIKNDQQQQQQQLDKARAVLPTMWQFHWRIFGDSLGICYAIVSYPPAQPFGQQQQQQQAQFSSSTASSENATTSCFATHEENTPGVKQSMSNMFVLLCEALKTARAVEPPTSKQLISNLDLVHEVVEIVCPGNGRCMPLFDTAMARKIWKMRNGE